MMTKRFRNRTQAGELLAEKLAGYAGAGGILVLALPRGGVPVAVPVALRLRAQLDVLTVRKLGVPGHEELAMGAIASGGVRVLNQEVVGALQIPDDIVERVASREQRELERRERAYRGDRPAPALAGRDVVLIDDGIATGSTMRSAIGVARGGHARRVIVAAPVIAASTVHEMRKVADDVVFVLDPDDFVGVGKWYDDFTQTTDEEVKLLLASAQPRPAG
jgi:putative phosphoribosyl transferase